MGIQEEITVVQLFPNTVSEVEALIHDAVRNTVPEHRLPGEASVTNGTIRTMPKHGIAGNRTANMTLSIS